MPIYSIRMGDPQSKGSAYDKVGPDWPYSNPGDTDYVDVAVLKQISTATGGEAIIVSTADKNTAAAFSSALANIGSILTGGYTIGVIADDGSTPNVAVRSAPGAKVRVTAISFKLNPKTTPPVPAYGKSP